MTLSQLEANDKPGQTACLINGRLDWLPTDAHYADITDDIIDIDEFIFSLSGLPSTTPRSARNENADNGVTI